MRALIRRVGCTLLWSGALSLCYAVQAWAGPYSGNIISTGPGVALENLAGTMMVFSSSGAYSSTYSYTTATIQASTPSIVLSGPTGRVTATSFAGDGSLLTGVVASSFAAHVAAPVTGDGTTAHPLGLAAVPQGLINLSTVPAPGTCTLPNLVLATNAGAAPTCGQPSNVTGNAATVTTNANLTGPVTSVGNATSIPGPIPQAAVNLSTVPSAGSCALPNVVTALNSGAAPTCSQPSDVTGSAASITGPLPIGQINLSTVPVAGSCVLPQVMTAIAGGASPTCQEPSNVTGNAATVTTNANLTGPVTSVGNATSIPGPIPQVAVNLSTVPAPGSCALPNVVTAINAGAAPSCGQPSNVTGNAATVTTNANLTGPVTSVGNATSIPGPVPQVAVNLSTVPVAGSCSLPNVITAINAGSAPTCSQPSNVTGNAATVTTNANLTGPVTSVGNATSIPGPVPASAVNLSTVAPVGMSSSCVTGFVFDASHFTRGSLDGGSCVAAGAGTVTTTGSPLAGYGAQFSGPTSITIDNLFHTGSSTTLLVPQLALAQGSTIAVNGGGMAFSTYSATGNTPTLRIDDWGIRGMIGGAVDPIATSSMVFEGTYGNANAPARGKPFFAISWSTAPSTGPGSKSEGQLYLGQDPSNSNINLIPALTLWSVQRAGLNQTNSSPRFATVYSSGSMANPAVPMSGDAQPIANGNQLSAFEAYYSTGFISMQLSAIQTVFSSDNGAYIGLDPALGASLPSELRFLTRSSGTITNVTPATEHFRIDPWGNLSNTAATPGATFDLKGNGSTLTTAVKVSSQDASEIMSASFNGSATGFSLYGGTMTVKGGIMATPSQTFVQAKLAATSQKVAASADQQVMWESPVKDTQNSYGGATSSNTFTTRGSGWYAIHCQVEVQEGCTGQCRLYIQAPAATTTIAAAFRTGLAVNDAIEVNTLAFINDGVTVSCAFHNADASVKTLGEGDSYGTFFSMGLQ